MLRRNTPHTHIHKWATKYKNNRMLLNTTKTPNELQRGGPKCKFGVQVPSTIKQACELDEKNGDSAWTEAIKEEMNS